MFDWLDDRTFSTNATTWNNLWSTDFVAPHDGSYLLSWAMICHTPSSHDFAHARLSVYEKDRSNFIHVTQHDTVYSPDTIQGIEGAYKLDLIRLGSYAFIVSAYSESIISSVHVSKIRMSIAPITSSGVPVDHVNWNKTPMETRFDRIIRETI